MATSGGPISAQLQQVLDSRPDEGVVGGSGQERRDSSGAQKHASNKGGAGVRRKDSRSNATRPRPPEARQPETRPPEGPSGGGGGNRREEDPRTLAQMYDRLIMGIIRPPRMSYEYPRALGPTRVVLPCGVKTERTDFEVGEVEGAGLMPEGGRGARWGL